MGRIEAMEDFEDFSLMFCGNADAVVPYLISDDSIFGSSRDLDCWRAVWMAIFERIIQQIREDLIDLSGIAAASGKRLDADGRTGLLELEFHCCLDAGEHCIHIEWFDFQGGPPKAREAQKTRQQRVNFGHARKDELNGLRNI